MNKEAELHQKFIRLKSAADTLNERSDMLNREVDTIDKAIAKLNLGIYCEVNTNNENIKLCYGKIDKKWGIFIKQIDTGEYWFFKDAPRPYRVTCSHFFIELIEGLANVADATTGRIIKATNLAKEYLQAFKDGGENK